MEDTKVNINVTFEEIYKELCPTCQEKMLNLASKSGAESIKTQQEEGIKNQLKNNGKRRDKRINPYNRNFVLNNFRSNNCCYSTKCYYSYYDNSRTNMFYIV